MDLEGIVLNEISQRKTNAYVIIYMWNLKIKLTIQQKRNKHRHSTNLGSAVGGGAGWGRGCDLQTAASEVSGACVSCPTGQHVITTLNGAFSLQVVIHHCAPETYNVNQLYFVAFLKMQKLCKNYIIR